jgi:RNA recognition motif-containing protein
LEYSEVTKLYVGNLPFTATEDSVRALFTPHGTVEKISLISDRETGRPRGFGFVEMSNADASRAMQALNGQDFDGRALKINEAQDRAAGGGNGGGRGPRRY